MNTNRNGRTLSLGAMVEKLFDQASVAANDAGAAADFAAHRLEQVLTRGGNTRLAHALSDLALELAPGYTSSQARLTVRSSSSRLAA